MRLCQLTVLACMMSFVWSCGETGWRMNWPAMALPAGTVRNTPAPLGAAFERRPQISAQAYRLWQNAGGPMLRGAVLYQRRYYQATDAGIFDGPTAGPSFGPEDMRALSECGANAVVLSHPGVFTEEPPFRADPALVKHLDRMIEKVVAADMFVVIALRTGPGRSEFTFFYDEAGTWFPRSMLNDTVWNSRDAQDAWVRMWRYVAKRYRDVPNVVGYELMVEPNSNDVGADARRPLGVTSPRTFAARYAGTLYDWNQFQQQIVRGIRGVDPHIPLLVPSNNYANPAWLDIITANREDGVVLTAHAYGGGTYTNQQPGDSVPFLGDGASSDDADGSTGGPAWSGIGRDLGEISRQIGARDVPLAVTEFGAVRWAPGITGYMNDVTRQFDRLGTNNFVYEWGPDNRRYLRESNAFNVRLGPDPGDTALASSGGVLPVLCRYWQRNRVRPSTIERFLIGETWDGLVN